MRYLRIEQSYFYSFLLVVATLMSQFLGHAGSIIYYVGVIVIYFSERNINVIRNTILLLVPITISLLIGLFIMRYSVYDVFKDAFYLTSPIIMLMLGEIFAKKMSSESFLMMVVCVGTFFAIINIAGNLMASGLQILIDPREVRDESEDYFGSVNFFSILAFFVLYYWRFFYRENLTGFDGWVLLINGLAIYFSGSRTYWLAVLLVIFMMYYPAVKKKYLILFSVIFLTAVTVYLSTSNSTGADRIRHSLAEMTISEYEDISGKHLNYRGYEAFMALKEYSQYGIFNKALGGGMGAVVDMGEDSPVGIQYIPILHNGYPYLLIKMGLFGTILFIYYFVSLIYRYIRWDVNIGDGNDYFWRVISCGSIAAMLLMHSSVNAFFNSGYNASLIFVGFSLTYMTWKELDAVEY